jgi:hypothetical protein
MGYLAMWSRLKAAYAPHRHTLRFGQFLVNACGTRDIFHLSDDALVLLAEKYSHNKGTSPDV